MELNKSGLPPPPPLQVLLRSGTRFYLMCAGPQSHLAGLCLAGIGPETSGRDHFAFLQPIEPIPEKQTGDYNTTITTTAAKTGQGAQERTDNNQTEPGRGDKNTNYQ